MKITINLDEVRSQRLVTSMHALCVKLKRSAEELPNGIRFGRISEPDITSQYPAREYRNNHWLYAQLAQHKGMVKVVGYGWSGAIEENFMWEGTPQEFIETWEGD